MDDAPQSSDICMRDCICGTSKFYGPILNL
jgi:hypothetical protein